MTLQIFYPSLLQGIEGAGETLEQLWISYNQIDKLKPIRNMTKLHTLYMAHNLVGATGLS